MNKIAENKQHFKRVLFACYKTLRDLGSRKTPPIGEGMGGDYNG